MAFLLAILAASPLAAAHAFGAVGYNHPLPRQDSASTSSFNAYNDCPSPSVLSLITQLPTPPAALESALETIQDPCELVTGSLPASVTSEFDSYTSALSSFASANSPALSSYDSYLTSWASSLASATPECSSIYSTITQTDDATDPFSDCPTGAASATAVGAGTTSAAVDAASSAATTSAAAANAASSGSTGSSTSKPSSASRGVGVPHSAVFVFGASVVIGCFVAMIVL